MTNDPRLNKPETENPSTGTNSEQDVKRRPIPATKTSEDGIKDADNADYTEGVNIGP